MDITATPRPASAEAVDGQTVAAQLTSNRGSDCRRGDGERPWRPTALQSAHCSLVVLPCPAPAMAPVGESVAETSMSEALMLRYQDPASAGNAKGHKAALACGNKPTGLVTSG